ncbi:ParB N-terminal domain-containing protein [Marispirochaeta sp.]|jgi:ParB family transcriptional regulator, chromosome partitioning protein|uniref:ParB/RepB/Spo0J family partition protein n=1 Tax=Marispirochaeta sp. TaxID=2038653 RepID=UPI0029C93202|nr:ParB N-terminal domain-containing protein [Marispirochaeta sp.]
MQINIKEISVKNRIRVNLGNLNQLMESIRRYGLMNPITVTPKYELIAGHRRLEAVKRLGMQTIEARIVDNLNEADRLEMEIDENLHRRPLNPDELSDGYTRLTKLRNPGFFRRLWRSISGFFKRLFKFKGRR